MVGLLAAGPMASPRSDRIRQRRRDILLCVAAAGVAFAGAGGATVSRALVGMAGFLVFVLIALSGRQTALSLTFGFLVLLGFIRRLLIPFAGWSPNDPLLLVGPAAAVTIWFFSRRTTPARPSFLSVIVTALTLWVVAQLANPNEPGLLVAAQGLLFYLGPLLWFFVGLHLTGSLHDRVLKTLFWMNVPVVVHGLYQTFFGLLPFELTWLGVSGQSGAIYVGGFRVRPFSTLVSPQEYGHFLSIALMIIWARLLRGEGQRGRQFAFFGVTAMALFYQASRGILLLFILGLVVVTVVHLRSLLAFLVILLAGVGLSLWVGAQDVSSTGSEDQVVGPNSTDVLVRHQLSGLTNPSQSTASLHAALVVESLGKGLDNPLGLGVSTSTLATKKAGITGERLRSAENDFGNVPAALGFPGALAYVAILFSGFARAIWLQRWRPSARHLAWIGILTVTLGQWLGGGLYAVAPIIWITLGGVARESAALMGSGGRPRTAIGELDP